MNALIVNLKRLTLQQEGLGKTILTCVTTLSKTALQSWDEKEI